MHIDIIKCDVFVHYFHFTFLITFVALVGDLFSVLLEGVDTGILELCLSFGFVSETDKKNYGLIKCPVENICI